MLVRVVVLLLGVCSYLVATGGAMVLCTGVEGTTAIELTVGDARCAESCDEGTTEGPDEPPAPDCVDEVIDVGDVRTVAPVAIALPSLNVLCGILPIPPALQSLQFEERENDPPQYLAFVATVVLVI